MRLAIASDHGGFELKQHLVGALGRAGHHVADLGSQDGESVDYPDFAERVGHAIAGGDADAGVLVCGSGIGLSIAANQVPGIRAAVVQDVEHARLAREHNDANVLCIGGRFTAAPLAEDMIAAWLGATCTGERHQRRLGKIAEIERRAGT